METSRRRRSHWILLYDTMKGASLEENFCCYFFYYPKSWYFECNPWFQKLPQHLQEFQRPYVTNPANQRVFADQPTRLRESRAKFLRAGGFVRTRCMTPAHMNPLVKLTTSDCSDSTSVMNNKEVMKVKCLLGRLVFLRQSSVHCDSEV